MLGLVVAVNVKLFDDYELVILMAFDMEKLDCNREHCNAIVLITR